MKNVGFFWWLAVIVGVGAILIHENVVRIANFSSFWTMTVAFGLLVLEGLFKKS